MLGLCSLSWLLYGVTADSGDPDFATKRPTLNFVFGVKYLHLRSITTISYMTMRFVTFITAGTIILIRGIYWYSQRPHLRRYVTCSLACNAVTLNRVFRCLCWCYLTVVLQVPLEGRSCYRTFCRFARTWSQNNWFLVRVVYKLHHSVLSLIIMVFVSSGLCFL